MALEKILILSTAHLSVATLDYLNATHSDLWPHSGNRVDYGFLMYAHDERPTFDPGKKCPDEVWACCVKARELGADWLKFDCDADEIDGLEVFDHGDAQAHAASQASLNAAALLSSAALLEAADEARALNDDAPGAEHERLNRDHAACDCCGRIEHIDLLDAKPDDPSNPAGCDWTRLECIACYGPGWVPAGFTPFEGAICDEMAGLYRGWRITSWIRGCIADFHYWRTERRWAREKAARRAARN